MRTIEGEGRNLDPESLAVVFLHFIATFHDAAWRRKGAAAGVAKAAAGRQHRLLANHARARDFLYRASGVRDPPIAIEQLHPLCAMILDLDVISPDKMAVLRRGLLFQVARLDRDLDGAGGLTVNQGKAPFTLTGGHCRRTASTSGRSASNSLGPASGGHRLP